MLTHEQQPRLRCLAATSVRGPIRVTSPGGVLRDSIPRGRVIGSESGRAIFTVARP